jgi:hypothetical protein
MSARQVADERADLVECVHGFGQECPEDVEVMGGHRVDRDLRVDTAFFAVLGEQLGFLQDRVAGGGVDEQRGQPCQLGAQRVSTGSSAGWPPRYACASTRACIGENSMVDSLGGRWVRPSRSTHGHISTPPADWGRSRSRSASSRAKASPPPRSTYTRGPPLTSSLRGVNREQPARWEEGRRTGTQPGRSACLLRARCQRRLNSRAADTRWACHPRYPTVTNGAPRADPRAGRRG